MAARKMLDRDAAWTAESIQPGGKEPPPSEREMSLGRVGGRPYRLAPQRDPPASAALPRLTYTVAEVAEMLGHSRQFVYDLIEEGQIPARRYPGRNRGMEILRCDLDAFLSSMEEV